VADAGEQGRFAAAGGGFVDDVVVDEAGGVEQLDSDRHVHGGGAGRAADAAGKDRQGGAHALSAARQDHGQQGAHEAVVREGSTHQLPLDLAQLVVDQAEQRARSDHYAPPRPSRLARNPNKWVAFREVCPASALGSAWRISANRANVSGSSAGSFRVPRFGAGARYGASVSTTIRLAGTRRAAATSGPSRLKVSGPANDTRSPTSRQRWPR